MHSKDFSIFTGADMTGSRFASRLSFGAARCKPDKLLPARIGLGQPVQQCEYVFRRGPQTRCDLTEPLANLPWRFGAGFKHFALQRAPYVVIRLQPKIDPVPRLTRAAVIVIAALVQPAPQCFRIDLAECEPQFEQRLEQSLNVPSIAVVTVVQIAVGAMRSFPVMSDAYARFRNGEIMLWDWGEPCAYPSPLVMQN